MKTLHSFFDGFLSLIYPDLCLVCEENIPTIKGILCTGCQYRLRETKFHLDRENEFTKRFWGRINIHAGAALYRFVKEGRAQSLIHSLKYDGKKEVGLKLGKSYGRSLLESPYFTKIDMIIPVPLHARKLQLRGYNQSALFAQGISEAMQIPWTDKVLVKPVNTTTQTKKSRVERFENVRHSFEIKSPDEIRNKHVLLVDDVLTTGATLEACAEKLVQVENTKVSLATIAIGSL